MSLKILSYNTLYAGADGGDRSRAAKQVELINDVHPDIFLMQEAKGFEENGSSLLFKLERDIGMRGFLAPAPHTGLHTIVFIRKPLRPRKFEADNVHFHHALARLDLMLPSGAKMTVMSAHLCSKGAPVRRLEAAYIAPLAEPDKLALVAGDFNSISHFQREPKDFADLAPYRRTHYLAEDAKSADGTVMAALDAAGWIDVGQRLGQGEVATVPAAGHKDSEFPTMRCDYVLATRALAAKARSYDVIKTPLTDIASDHYPVVVEFEI